ncbi:hypothetical protein DFJ58DRAFT_750229 [Suillus subalutaceus]|uniref:uncharacterized protein n=1 Tax=Suillus subalutaceus TaxID=48586 RepID=UPI001B864E99|nr:uncharacterized protein DFJ58DRAFT_750229 [Suillus subalutaceus]KAG1834009.1 hypothetical protein DFJ58DRAFT_750229 [Suillus subalutaceus]
MSRQNHTFFEVLYAVSCDREGSGRLVLRPRLPRLEDIQHLPIGRYLQQQGSQASSTGGYTVKYCGDLTAVQQAQVTHWIFDNIEGAQETVVQCILEADPDYPRDGTADAQEEFILETVWSTILNQTGKSTDVIHTDVDLECLSWGLDAGNHQDDWDPYAGLPSHWNHEDRDEGDPGYDEDELERGPGFSDSDDVEQHTSGPRKRQRMNACIINHPYMKEPRFKWTKRKCNTLRNSTPDTEETAPESLHPRESVHHDETIYALVKGGVKRSRISDIYLELRILDAVIGEIVDVHPYAKMALGVLSPAAKINLARVDRDAAHNTRCMAKSRQYAAKSRRCALSLERFLSKPVNVRVRSKIIQRPIKFTGKNVIWETEDTIQKYNNVFDTFMQTFRDQVAHNIAIHVHRREEILNLGNMTYADGTELDARKQCLQGTHTEILSQITEWLSGPGGKGKSAISHTIAKWFEDVGGLGSCYSFDHQREADHRHEEIFSTIVRDLADRDPEMRRALADAVQAASSLKKTADIIQQWQKLVIGPLGKSSGSTEEPIVIVINALYESGGEETRNNLLHILAAKHQDPAVPKITDLPIDFRFIVASRPLDDINDELHSVQHILQMFMDDIPLGFAERDIRAYVSKKLQGSGLDDREFAVLAKKPHGLFEWAPPSAAPPTQIPQSNPFTHPFVIS